MKDLLFNETDNSREYQNNVVIFCVISIFILLINFHLIKTTTVRFPIGLNKIVFNFEINYTLSEY